jgi:predicted O-methyltransferase YrrM
MNQIQWSAVERYFNDLLVSSDAALEAALQASQTAGLPPHNVTLNQGKLLQLLAQIQGARTILEIGTLGGYSTSWLARALPSDGRLISLEANPQHAEIARANIKRAGLEQVVDIRIGQASDTLAQLDADRAGPFDLIFIDADKPSYPDYLKWSLKLSRNGSVIIGDNVVRDGLVIDPESADARVQGVRRFCDLIASEPRLSATVLQTVGSKGYDGFLVARVTSEL